MLNNDTEGEDGRDSSQADDQTPLGGRIGRLLNGPVDPDDENLDLLEAPIGDAGVLLDAVWAENERLRDQAEAAAQRLRRAVTWMLVAWVCVASMVAGGAMAAARAAQSISRSTVAAERSAAQVRAEEAVQGQIAEDRDMARADLMEAREARARAEGELSAVLDQRGGHGTSNRSASVTNSKLPR